MAFTKINAAGIGTTETVTVDGLTVINDGSFGGNLTVSGVLTYEDVTNVDSVGLITARNGIVVGSGITLSKDGDVFFTGIATGNGSGLTALNASNLASGTVPTARLGSGTASSSTFLRGDSTFAAVTSTTINNNADNRVITGSGTADTLNGEANLTYNSTLLTITGSNEADILQLATGNSSGNTFAGIRGDNEAGIRIRGGGSQRGGEIDLGGGQRNTDPAVIKFSTNTSTSFQERARIDADGRLVIGHTSAQGVNSTIHRLQLIGTDFATSGFSQQRFQDNSSGASILLAHSRNGTIGSQTALQSGDELGKIRFIGSDGTDFTNVGAQIVVTADGNYSSDSVPGKIEFGTTANGSASPTTRMTIDQNGYVKMGTTAADAHHMIKLSTSTTNAIKDVVSVDSSVTGGTAADGFGSRLLFRGEHLNGNDYSYGGIAGKLSTTGSNYGHLSFYTNNNGTLGEKMRLTDASSGTLQLLGNSASVRTIESGGATALMQSGGNQAYFGTPSGNSKAVTFTVAGSQIAHFTTGGDMMLDNQLQTSSGVEPIGVLSFSGPSGALANQTDAYRINFWESARTITSTRTDNANASIRYCASTADGGDGSIRFSNENATRLLYMNRLGNGGTSGTWSVGSDQRKKENITTVSDALTKVSQLRGVDFNWRAKWGGHADSGVIAQEVESVLPNLVITQEGARDTDADGNSVVMKHVNYNGLWGAMIEAVKELKSKNEALEARIAALEG